MLEAPYLIVISLSYEGSGVSQPLPPARLLVGQRNYVLSAYTSVRQSFESVSPDKYADVNAIKFGPLHAVSESIIDLESRQKTMQCQVGFVHLFGVPSD
jgi:hypothetical protein